MMSKMIAFVVRIHNNEYLSFTFSRIDLSVKYIGLKNWFTFNLCVYLLGEFLVFRYERKYGNALFAIPKWTRGLCHFSTTSFRRDCIRYFMQPVLVLLLPGLHHQIIPHVPGTPQHAAIKLLKRTHSWTHV